MNIQEFKNNGVTVQEIEDIIDRLRRVYESLAIDLEFDNLESAEESKDFRFFSISALQQHIFAFTIWYLYNEEPQSDLGSFNSKQNDFIFRMMKDREGVIPIISRFLCNALIDQVYFSLHYLFANLNYYCKNKKHRDPIEFMNFVKEFNHEEGVFELISYWRNTFHSNGICKSEKIFNIKGVKFEFKKGENFSYSMRNIFKPVLDEIVSEIEVILKDEKFNTSDFKKELSTHFFKE